MKKILFFISLFFALSGFSQTVVGRWKTIDDETKKETSVVEIYMNNGKVYGKIVEIFDPAKRSRLCTDCIGEDKDKPVLGMTIIRGLIKDGNEYNDGKILDPKNGKLYKCYINLESKDKLKVRGYIGFSLLGRTQYWYRVKTTI
jgi:uncharacterized protein (DUF2147 family)